MNGACSHQWDSVYFVLYPYCLFVLHQDYTLPIFGLSDILSVVHQSHFIKDSLNLFVYQ